LNQDVVRISGLSEEFLKGEVARQEEEIRRRVELYRQGRKIVHIESKTVILVDDGVATGATIKAAIATLRRGAIRKLVTALPVAPPETAGEIKKLVDEFICLETPPDFMAVGNYYRDFGQISDEQVVKLLETTTDHK